MNNSIGIGFFYSLLNNSVAFAIVENSGVKIEVLAISEFSGTHTKNKVDYLIRSIYQNHDDDLILIKSEATDLNPFFNTGKNNVLDNSADDNKSVYTFFDMLNCNEKTALKLAVENFTKTEIKI